MKYRMMNESDIVMAAQLYVDYYNNNEDGEWTMETASKRIHQVWSREDAYCLLLEEEEKLVAFAFGYMEQYDDCFAYDLVEIVVAAEYQKQGIGKMLVDNAMDALEKEGITQVLLVVFKDNDNGNAFWEHIGFTKRDDLFYRNKYVK